MFDTAAVSQDRTLGLCKVGPAQNRAPTNPTNTTLMKSNSRQKEAGCKVAWSGTATAGRLKRLKQFM